MMMRILLILLVSVSLTGAARAQENPVQDTISNQIEAFKVDDFATAFSFASPMIKNMFGSPENFGMMVRRGYPMVWRPADVQFIGQEKRGPLVYQTVRIQDAQGAYHTLEYEMIPTENGWQINGVQFVEAPGLSA